jgi:hypothetical protein
MIDGRITEIGLRHVEKHAPQVGATPIICARREAT